MSNFGDHPTGFFDSARGFYNGTVSSSVRLDGNASLARDNADAGTSDKVATISMWFKRTELSALVYLLHSKNDSGAASFGITLDADDSISVTQYDGTSPFGAGNYDFGVTLNAAGTLQKKLRDTTAWYHLVVAINTTLGSGTTNEADRIKMYINGEQLTVAATDDGSGSQDFADKDQTLAIFQDGEIRLASTVDDGSYAHIYLAEVNGVDGLALDPSYFGELKDNVWIPKNPSVSEYGNHGFRLQMLQSGTGTAGTGTIGADTSGKGNHFTSAGVGAHDVVMPDCPENNFATLMGAGLVEPSDYQSYVGGGTYVEGNLKLTGTGDWSNGKSNFLVNSGKWYVEYRVTALHAATHNRFGVYARPARTYDEYFWLPNGSAQLDGGDKSSKVGTYTTNDILQVALDLENNNIFFGKNNTWENSATASEIVAGTSTNAFASGSEVPTGDGHDYGFYNNPHTSSAGVYNFGQDSSFAGTATAQGNSDSGDGTTDFYYAPPTGFLAMNSVNRPEPAVGPNSDVKNSDTFNTVVYDGTGSSNAVTGVGFQPDWVWIKKRSGGTSRNHIWTTSSRGVTKHLSSSLADAEFTNNNGLTAFGADGFTVGSYNSVNESGNSDKYVAWNWKMNGGTTVSHSAGDNSATEASVSQANTTAGMSIVTYTGDTSGHGSTYPSTFNHGIGATPRLIIVKSITSGQNHNWAVYHEELNPGSSYNHSLTLNSTAARNNANNAYWGGNTITLNNNLFGIGSDNTTGANGVAYIAFLFAQVEGFSKFQYYTGNANNDGPYNYCGFAPAFLIIKISIGHTESWHLWDNKRSVVEGNPNQAALSPNTTGNDVGGSTPYNIDFLSNGFKIREDHDMSNGSGDTYVWWAFAEAPAKYSNAK